MKAVVWHGVGDISLDEVPDPTLREPTDEIVELTTSAICGTDLHFVRGTMGGMVEGTILGHEGVGVVREVGRQAEKIPPVAQFDGSVVVERTAGEVSARCHDEQANLLALNLTHDIVTDARTVGEAREHYAKESADARRKLPTPYMDKLRFAPGRDTADPDEPVLSDQDLQRAAEEGEQDEKVG
jgi:hypothetical protein